MALQKFTENLSAWKRLAVIRHILRFKKTALCLGLFVLISVGIYDRYLKDLPDVSELNTYRPKTVTPVLYRNGERLAMWAEERRMLISSYAMIPRSLREAILSAEDASFFYHPGVNPLSIARAAYKNMRYAVEGSRHKQGGSTITQQLARLVFLDPSDRSLERKIKEVWLSLMIELRFSKETIFTMYANQVYLGGGRYGFAAGADYYFGKKLNELEPHEAALLAGIIANPGEFSPRYHWKPECEKEEAMTKECAKVKNRRNEILRRMYDNGYVPSASELKKYSELPIVIISRPESSFAPHALERIKREIDMRGIPLKNLWNGGFTVFTTLDKPLQEAALRAVKEGIAEYEIRRKKEQAAEPNQKIEACLIVVEHATGQVVAEVGGRDFTANKWDHCFQSRRQTGSLFKTIVLAAALEPKPQQLTEWENAQEDALRDKKNEIKKFRRESDAVWSLDSLVNDSRRCFYSKPKPYCPQNYPMHVRYAGVIPLRRAFAESRNLAFLDLGRHILNRTVIMAEKFGLHNLPDTSITADEKQKHEKAEFIRKPNLSLILGSLEATPFEMASAFSAFAHNGRKYAFRMIEEIADENGDSIFPSVRTLQAPSEVISAPGARTMREALREVVLRGTAHRAAQELPAMELYGKTGTSSRSQADKERDATIDAWFCGFDAIYTACVWVGFDKPEDIGAHEAGGKTALPIFIKFMKYAYENSSEGPLGFTDPDEMIEALEH